MEFKVGQVIKIKKKAPVRRKPLGDFAGGHGFQTAVRRL